MSLKSTIKDGKGSDNLAGSSVAGELIIGAFPGATSSFQAMLAGQAFNFFSPKPGENLIITAIVMSTTGNSTIDVYEASSITSLTVDKELIFFSFSNPQVSVIPFPLGGSLQVTEGEFVNAVVTGGATVRMTIIGFYKPTGANFMI